MENEKFIVIDGNSLMHRAYYALPPLTNSKGMHTNVIYGFVNMLNKLIEEFKPSHIGIAFDRKAPTFRHTEYAEYKAGRQKMPEEMAEQIPVLKEVIAAMNIKQIEMDGFEADDLIGTISKHCDDHGMQTLIVTGDRDAFQLISDKVRVLITKKGISEIESFDAAHLQEIYQITPAQVTDLKGLMGDASDNIPGVPGVGEKTALELLHQFGSVEQVLENTSAIKKNKVRENVENNKEQAVFSKKLATIVRDVPIDFSMVDYTVKEADKTALFKLFHDLGFKTLIEKMCAEGGIAEAGKKTEKKAELVIRMLQAPEELEALLAEAEKAGEMAFKADYKESELLSAFYACVSGELYSFNINSSTIPYIKRLMESSKIKKLGHDVKQDILTLRHLGITTEEIAFDIMVAAYLLNPSKGSYTTAEIAREYLDIEIEGYEIKGGADTQQYCESVKTVFDLKPVLENKLKELEMDKLYYEVELPLISVLADIEYEGFKVDQEMLKVLSEGFSQQIDALTVDIYTLAGEQFNINSTKQLGVILFEKLGLPAVKKTKTGYSTDVEVLEALADKHPVIEKILEYRQLAKLKSTYVDGLVNLINPDTRKIHTKLNQTVTATGRLSSTDPNLQNIPIKTENGRQIRKVFVPSNADYILVDADYSQIELRVLAHISGDEGLIDAFVKNEDIHTRTASEVFSVDLDQVTPLQRKRAKAVNFGIVYGISDFGLSQDLKITRKEAKQYIDSYFERYPNVKKYMKDIVEEAKEKGYVTTILNRRRYIPEIHSRNAMNRNFGERIAMNTPIQGSAADLIKIAMIKVHRALKESGLKSKLILQVHDELIIETCRSEVNEVEQLVKRCMEEAYKLRVPVIADISHGESWYEAK